LIYASLNGAVLVLLEHISSANAGSITGGVMAIERDDASGGDDQYVLRAVTKTRDGQYVLRANNPDYADLPATEEIRTRARLKAIIDALDMSIGQSFSREDIPALFGETFNPGSWNAGHVTLEPRKAHVLLVTLNKQGKADEQERAGDRRARQARDRHPPLRARGETQCRQGCAVHLLRQGDLPVAQGQWSDERDLHSV
jgi:hypothetical protein